jgi:hypothetical protein
VIRPENEVRLVELPAGAIEYQDVGTGPADGYEPFPALAGGGTCGW